MFVLLLQQEETLKICKKKRKNTPENRSHSSILFPPSFFACFENAQGGHHPGHQSNDRAGRAGEGQVSSASSVPALHILCNSEIQVICAMDQEGHSGQTEVLELSAIQRAT